jgi:uncharacterized protein (DUF1697 family)
MDQYIAFLRGINVAGNNIRHMKEVQVILERLGCEDVKTYIQSGDACFKSDTITVDNISTTITNAKGFTPKLLLLSQKNLSGVLKNNPFPEAEAEAEPKTLSYTGYL